jgi:hypothetical protein
MEASTKISKEGPGGQAMFGRVRVPVGNTAMCEVVRVNPKLQWRPLDIGDARNGTSAEESHRQGGEPIQERSHVGSKWQGHRGRSFQAL